MINERISVLDKGWIEGQTVMGDDQAVVDAARTSTNTLGRKRDNAAFIKDLMRKRHTSPFEQVEFRFRLRAPVLVWWQWVRHRTWSYLLESARYNEMKPDFYVPDDWRRGVDFSQVLDTALETHYRVSYNLYRDAIDRAVPPELARLFLPGFALYYTGVAKTDAHNLMHFLKLRMAPEAQYEIRQYAIAIYEHFFKPALPLTAAAFEKYVLGE
jgi:thymidylate synthase (FAD)